MNQTRSTPLSLDIVFIQDTQKTLNNFFYNCARTIENFITHASCLPRYRLGGVRIGLVAYHDNEQTPASRCTEILGLTANYEQLLHSVHSLKAKQTAPLSDGENSALRYALQSAVKLDWSSKAEKVIVLSTYKRSRPLDVLALDTFRLFSKERIHLYIANGMQLPDLFDDGGDGTLVQNIMSLDIGVPVHLAAFISAAMQAHSATSDAARVSDNSSAPLVNFILWSWGCDRDSCIWKASGASEPNEVKSPLSERNDEPLHPIDFGSLSPASSGRVEVHVVPRMSASRGPSAQSDVVKSPTTTLVAPLSPEVTTVTEMDELSEKGKGKHLELLDHRKSPQPTPKHSDGRKDENYSSHPDRRKAESEGDKAESPPMASNTHAAESAQASQSDLTGIEGKDILDAFGNTRAASSTPSENMDTVASDAGDGAQTEEMQPAGTESQEETQQAWENRVNHDELESINAALEKPVGNGKSKIPESRDDVLPRAVTNDVRPATTTSQRLDAAREPESTSDPTKENGNRLPATSFGDARESENAQPDGSPEDQDRRLMTGSVIAEQKRDHMIDAGVQSPDHKLGSKGSRRLVADNGSRSSAGPPLSTNDLSNTSKIFPTGSTAAELRKRNIEIEIGRSSFPQLRIDSNALMSPPMDKKPKVMQRLSYSQVLKRGITPVSVSNPAGNGTHNTSSVNEDVSRPTESGIVASELVIPPVMDISGLPYQESQKATRAAASQLYEQCVTHASSNDVNEATLSVPPKTILVEHHSDVPGIAAMDSRMVNPCSGGEVDRPEDVAVRRLPVSAPDSGAKNEDEVALRSENIADGYSKHTPTSVSAYHPGAPLTTARVGQSCLAEPSQSGNRQPGANSSQSTGSSIDSYHGYTAATIEGQGFPKVTSNVNDRHSKLNHSSLSSSDCFGNGDRQEGQRITQDEAERIVRNQDCNTHEAHVVSHDSSAYEEILAGKPDNNLTQESASNGSSYSKLAKHLPEKGAMKQWINTPKDTGQGSTQSFGVVGSSSSSEQSPHNDTTTRTRMPRPTGSQVEESDLAPIGPDSKKLCTGLRGEAPSATSSDSAPQAGHGLDGLSLGTYEDFPMMSPALDNAPCSESKMVLNNPEPRTLASASSKAHSQIAALGKRSLADSESAMDIDTCENKRDQSITPRHFLEVMGDYSKNQQSGSSSTGTSDSPKPSESFTMRQTSSNGSDTLNAEGADSPLIGQMSVKRGTKQPIDHTLSNGPNGPNVPSNVDDERKEADNIISSATQQVHRSSAPFDLADIRPSAFSRGVSGSPDVNFSRHAVDHQGDTSGPTIEKQLHDKISGTGTDTKDGSNEVHTPRSGCSFSSKQGGRSQMAKAVEIQPQNYKDQEQSSREKEQKSPFSRTKRSDSVSSNTCADSSNLNASSLDNSQSKSKPTFGFETDVPVSPNKTIHKVIVPPRDRSASAVAPVADMPPSNEYLPPPFVPSSAASLSHPELCRESPRQFERTSENIAKTASFSSTSDVSQSTASVEPDVRHDGAPIKDSGQATSIENTVSGQEASEANRYPPRRSPVPSNTTSADSVNVSKDARPPTPLGSRSLSKLAHDQTKISPSYATGGNRIPGGLPPLASEGRDASAPDVRLTVERGAMGASADRAATPHEGMKGLPRTAHEYSEQVTSQGQGRAQKYERFDESSSKHRSLLEVTGKTKKLHLERSQNDEDDNSLTEAVSGPSCSSQEESTSTSMKLRESCVEALPDSGFSGSLMTCSNGNLASTEKTSQTIVPKDGSLVDTDNDTKAAPRKAGHLVHDGDVAEIPCPSPQSNAETRGFVKDHTATSSSSLLIPRIHDQRHSSLMVDDMHSEPNMVQSSKAIHNGRGRATQNAGRDNLEHKAAAQRKESLSPHRSLAGESERPDLSRVVGQHETADRDAFATSRTERGGFSRSTQGKLGISPVVHSGDLTPSELLACGHSSGMEPSVEKGATYPTAAGSEKLGSLSSPEIKREKGLSTELQSLQKEGMRENNGDSGTMEVNKNNFGQTREQGHRHSQASAADTEASRPLKPNPLFDSASSDVFEHAPVASPLYSGSEDEELPRSDNMNKSTTRDVVKTGPRPGKAAEALRPVDETSDDIDMPSKTWSSGNADPAFPTYQCPSPTSASESRLPHDNSESFRQTQSLDANTPPSAPELPPHESEGRGKNEADSGSETSLRKRSKAFLPPTSDQSGDRYDGSPNKPTKQPLRNITQHAPPSTSRPDSDTATLESDIGATGDSRTMPKAADGHIGVITKNSPESMSTASPTILQVVPSQATGNLGDKTGASGKPKSPRDLRPAGTGISTQSAPPLRRSPVVSSDLTDRVGEQRDERSSWSATTQEGRGRILSGDTFLEPVSSRRPSGVSSKDVTDRKAAMKEGAAEPASHGQESGNGTGEAPPQQKHENSSVSVPAFDNIPTASANVASRNSHGKQERENAPPKRASTEPEAQCVSTYGTEKERVDITSAKTQKMKRNDIPSRPTKTAMPSLSTRDKGNQVTSSPGGHDSPNTSTSNPSKRDPTSRTQALIANDAARRVLTEIAPPSPSGLVLEKGEDVSSNPGAPHLENGPSKNEDERKAGRGDNRVYSKGLGQTPPYTMSKDAPSQPNANSNDTSVKTNDSDLTARTESTAGSEKRRPVLRLETSPTLNDVRTPCFGQSEQAQLGASPGMTPMTRLINTSRTKPQLSVRMGIKQDTLSSPSNLLQQFLNDIRDESDIQSESPATKVPASVPDATQTRSTLGDSSVSENVSSLENTASNRGTSLRTPMSVEERKMKAKQARAVINEELRRPPVPSPKVPFKPGVELGEKPISREQTRRVVLDALMAFTRLPDC